MKRAFRVTSYLSLVLVARKGKCFLSEQSPLLSTRERGTPRTTMKLQCTSGGYIGEGHGDPNPLLILGKKRKKSQEEEKPAG